MVAMADANATLTPAMLSPEIQASRRTIAATAAADAEIRVRIDQPLPDAVELLEQTMVRSALNRSHGRVEEAARLLGISRKGLFLKRRRWALDEAS
jgi:DNA-binding NtrC family response regulator